VSYHPPAPKKDQRLPLDIGLAVGGLAVLILAADRLVVSATRLARFFGVSTVLIGAVIVGFGTSIPEFVVTIIAGLKGEIDLAMSNVVGSNTANLTLVLGGAALVATLVARQSVVRREGYLMMAAVAALAVVLWDGTVTRLGGVVLVGLLIVALSLLVLWSRPAAVASGERGVPDRAVPHGRKLWAELSIAVVALAATLIAAQFLVDGVIGVGERLGWSAAFLGMITGVGTSLPELAAGLASSRKRESDLTIGNVLGSNIFNSLGVAGVAAILAPGSLASLSTAMLVVMVGVAVIAGVFAVTGQRIVRWEGLALLLAFGVYAVVVI